MSHLRRILSILLCLALTAVPLCWLTPVAQAAVESLDTAVLALSPHLYWKIQETGGTAIADTSGNSRPGTATIDTTNGGEIGSATSLVSSEPSDKSLKSVAAGIVNGSSITQDTATWQPTVSQTIIIKVKLISYPSASSGANILIATNTLTGATGGFRITVGTTGLFQFTDGTNTSASDFSLALNTVYNIIISQTFGAGGTIYINGRSYALGGTTNSMIAPTTARKIVVGSARISAYFSHAAVFSNSALTNSQAMRILRATWGVDKDTSDFYSSGTATSTANPASLADPISLRELLASNALVASGSTIWLKGHTSDPSYTAYASGDYRAQPLSTVGEDVATAGTGLGTFRVTLQGTVDDPIWIKNVPCQRARFVDYNANLLLNQDYTLYYETSSRYVHLQGERRKCASVISGIEFVNFNNHRSAVTQGSDPGTINIGRLTNGTALFQDINSSGVDQDETNFVSADHVGKSFNYYLNSAAEAGRTPTWVAKIQSVTNVSTVVLDTTWTDATIQLGSSGGYPRVKIEGNATSPGADVGGRGVASGMYNYGDFNKFINVAFHDLANGIGDWSQGEGTENYAPHLYANGWSGGPEDRGHGHGLYQQNLLTSAFKYNREFVSHHNFETGGKSFSVNFETCNVENDGWAAWENGAPEGILDGATFRAANYLVGSDTGTPTQFITIKNGHYYHSVSHDTNLWAGTYSYQNTNLTLTGNTIIRGQNVLTLHSWTPATVTGNTLWTDGGSESGPKLIIVTAYRTTDADVTTSLSYNSITLDNNIYKNTGASGKYFQWAGTAAESNAFYFNATPGVDFGTSPAWQNTTALDATSTYARSALTGQTITVRPNAYETGSGNVIIENLSGGTTATVPLTLLGLVDGQEFEIRDAETYYGDPVASGVYGTGGGKVTSISVPVSSRTLTQPYGITGLTASNEFSVFFVLPGEQSDAVTPDAPTGLSPNLGTSSGVTLRYTVPAVGNAATGCTVQRSTDGISYSNITTSAPFAVGAQTFTDPTVSVDPKRLYYYRIALTNVAGSSVWVGPVMSNTPVILCYSLPCVR